jgi:hypothetical protein
MHGGRVDLLHRAQAPTLRLGASGECSLHNTAGYVRGCYEPTTYAQARYVCAETTEIPSTSSRQAKVATGCEHIVILTILAVEDGGADWAPRLAPEGA